MEAGASGAGGAALAPPTSRGTPQQPPRAVWPMVVGIVLIVFGGGGVLLYAFGFVFNLILPYLEAFQDPTLGAVSERYHLLSLAVGLANLLVSCVLLAAGVGMVRRRRWSIPLAVAWAVARILVVIVATAVQALVVNEQFDAMASAGAGVTGISTTMVVATVVVGLAFGWALPVFVLVWLQLPFVRREVAGWGTAAPAGTGGVP